MNLSRPLVIVAALALSACTWQRLNAFQQTQLGGYKFDLVDSSNQQVEFLLSPKLSDDGAIAYRTFNFDSSSAIYFSDGGAPQKIIGSDYVYGSRRIDLINVKIDMNNSHVIAFSTSYIGAIDSAVFGVFTLTPQGTLTRVSTNDPSTYFNSLAVSINDSNNLAYLGSASSYADVYATTPAGPVRIFRGGDFNRSPTDPEINSSALITFAGDNSNAGSPGDLFVYSNGQMTKIDSGQAGDNNRIVKPGLNDAGQIAYDRQTSINSYELKLFESGQSAVLPVDNVVGSRVELNNVGVIGFYGRNANNTNGIRTYAQGAINDVLGIGDNLFGKQIQSVGVWDINDRNQLALTATFTDGSSAILIATPVPEPTSVGLLISAMAIALFASRVRCLNRA